MIINKMLLINMDTNYKRCIDVIVIFVVILTLRLDFQIIRFTFLRKSCF